MKRKIRKTGTASNETAGMYEHNNESHYHNTQEDLQEERKEEKLAVFLHQKPLYWERSSRRRITGKAPSACQDSEMEAKFSALHERATLAVASYPRWRPEAVATSKTSSQSVSKVTPRLLRIQCEMENGGPFWQIRQMDQA